MAPLEAATLPTPADSLPSTIEAATATLVTRYASAEQQLIRDSSAIVAKYAADPAPVVRAAMALELQAVARRIAYSLGTASGELANSVAVEAARRGNSAGIREVTTALRNHPALKTLYTRNTGDGTTAHGLNAAQHIARDLTSRLTAVEYRITRFADDAYRAATSHAAMGQVTGRTPQLAQREAWRALTAGGVAGFTDAKGRDWELSTYVEMATRTAAIRAYNESHQDRMTALGVQYWTVGPTGFPCKLCLPWEGQVLSVGGAGVVTTPAADGGDAVTFQVAGTLDEARAAGLQHPNCKHTLVAFFPGVTQLVTRTPDEIDQAVERFKETQRLRAMERAVRQSKMAELASLNDTDRAAARRRTRELQAQIRAYTDQTGLMRRSRREQLDLGNK